ncbi:hypothetical protein TI39_contig264g00007 [Zymoseptoria brevis]|uniref:Uncharacterized protein n=1 Tax=Zymoseptoria brevis TaxID=1047168 RepID=A0A0F4GYB2_9PEZI|nr:hypothetical protein TI39_contig264g00007 [Zymoseptoria brevis]
MAKTRSKRAKPATTKAPPPPESSPPPAPVAEEPETIGFLSLPPEIRNMVYGMVLCHDETIIFYKGGYGFHPAGRAHGGPCGNKPLGAKVLLPRLLYTNSAIHHEAATILYGENKFVVAMSEAVSEDLHFFNRIGDCTRNEVFEKVGEMAKLESLTWCHDLKIKEAAAVKLLLPCVRAVQKRLDEAARGGESRSAVEVLHFAQCTGKEVPFSRPKHVAWGWDEDLEEALKASVKDQGKVEKDPAENWGDAVKAELQRLLDEEAEEEADEE